MEIEGSGKLPEGLMASEVGKEENPIIKVKTEKGESIEFNFEQIKSKVVDFYKKNNLEELAGAVESATIFLTREQKRAMVEMVEKEGFDSAWIFTGAEREHLADIKKATEQKMGGLVEAQQYSPDGTYLYSDVGLAFPDKLSHEERPEKFYIKLYKSSLEVDEKTLNVSHQDTKKNFTDRNLSMDTLPEYLILQRVMTQENQNKGMAKPHPETKYATWLGSALPPLKKGGPGRVLRADWYPEYRRVWVCSYAPDDSHSYIGARPSAIFEIP